MRAVVTLALCVLLSSAVSSAYAADPITPADAILESAELDQSIVTLQGEAIGESLRADSTHRWVNLLEGGKAIGVYISAEDADRISRFGDHRGTGDTVAVTGRLNRACTQHAGEMDVHADELVVISAGATVENPPDGWKGIAGAALLVLAFVEYRVFRYLRERRA